MSTAPVVVLLDFDGTLTTRDTGDAICERLVPEAFATFKRQVSEAQVPIDELQRAIWRQVVTTADVLDDVLEQVLVLRKGSVEFVRSLLSSGIRTVLLSGGFDLYIDRALAQVLHAAATPWPAAAATYPPPPPARETLEVVTNHAQLDPNEGIRTAFPFRHHLGCPRCAICKGRVASGFQRQGYTTILCGDGHSDLCAANVVDELWAVAGSQLAQYAKSAAIACRTFADFGAVERDLRARKIFAQRD